MRELTEQELVRRGKLENFVEKGMDPFGHSFKQRDSYSQDEVMGIDVFCPKCNSKNILIQKGDGHRINGADFIAVICHDCKKVYGFNDIKYKPNCPKEI